MVVRKKSKKNVEKNEMNNPEDLRMWYAARILEGSFYALSLAEGYVVVRRWE